jgi:hypothetical protein
VEAAPETVRAVVDAPPLAVKRPPLIVDDAVERMPPLNVRSVEVAARGKG